MQFLCEYRKEPIVFLTIALQFSDFYKNIFPAFMFLELRL